jgi:hypothetical protein
MLQKLESDALLKSPQELLAVLQWVQQHVTAVELQPGMAGDLFFDPSGRLTMFNAQCCSVWDAARTPDLCQPTKLP